MKTSLVVFVACCAATGSAFALQGGVDTPLKPTSQADLPAVNPPRYVRADLPAVNPPRSVRADLPAVNPPRSVRADLPAVNPPRYQ